MAPDLICVSHLRWNFVYQRPQHLMSRFRKYHRIFYIEEPIYEATSRGNEVYQDVRTGVHVVVPHFPLSARDNPDEQQHLFSLFLLSKQVRKMILWYYTPLGLSFTSHLSPVLTVYDCMDELSAFRFAPPSLREAEKQLMHKADIVFTGGQRLFEAKKNLHHNIHPFPSSIDKEHFEQARRVRSEPEDQVNIPHPRIGYYGVIDERLDISLLAEVASMHPAWHFIMVGPTAKIERSALPRLNNIHFLGQKEYKTLPAYLSGWDVAMMPFALNESTEFISPTKTPEYLAGGKPVVSTPIADVVKPYGELGLVQIAKTASEFASALEKELQQKPNKQWLVKVDTFLADISWNKTWMEMSKLMGEALERKKQHKDTKNEEVYV